MTGDRAPGRYAEAVGPDGLRYSVRSHPDGQAVLNRPSPAQDARAVLAWLPVRAVEQIRRWRRGGWEVAVVLEPIRRSRFQYTFARVVHREHVDTETQIAATVRDLAARVERGDLPAGPATRS